MNDKLEYAQHKFIEGTGKLCASFGLNKLLAQIYALLYLSNKPLSLDEIVERLKVSKGSVSLNIRELDKWGAVKSVWVKGSRKDYYEAEVDIKKVISNKLKSGIAKRLAEVSDMTDQFNSIVQSADAELAEEEKHIARMYTERLDKINELKILAMNAIAVAEKLM